MPRRYTKLIFLIHIIIYSSSLLHGQHSPEEIPNDSSRLKLYMDCNDCDFAYFRRNLPYLDFVRDPKLSDIHLLVTEQRTGSNGSSYGLNFIGSGNYSELNYKLNVVSLQSDTQLESWERLLKTTSMGLMPYLTSAPEYQNIRIQYENNKPGEQEDKVANDSWNYWVFRSYLGSDLQLEESQSEISSMGSFRIDRITEQLKIRADISYDRDIERFQDDTETIESLREEIDSDIEVVFSLKPRWSFGVFNEIKSSTYQNIDFSQRLGPAIEYNIFPWDKSDRRIFSFGYHLNAHYFNYHEETIFNLSKEFRASETLKLLLVLREPWGEVETEIEGSHYFHDFSKNRLSLESRISVNISKGISIYTEIEAALIHDQLYLPAGEITLEELLLRQRQLESAYEISAEFGISFTFGSIYNNIVNQRL
ncbi:MAG: hypothetical protein PF450_01445 [Bacteroidales bacterium]|jgi:hypothetical protein|nr:hypothetical protein [Bacteroidales bacterium]